MLTDRKLLRTIKRKGVVVPFDPSNCQKTSVDLMLDKEIESYVSDKPILSDEDIPKKNYKTFDILIEGFSLQPGQSVFIKTVETVHIPRNTSASVCGRTDIERMGLMIQPIHCLDPGYKGKITVLVVNHSSVPVQLVAGVEICQLSLHELSIDKINRRRVKKIKSTFILLNSMLTALIAYAINLTNWPMVWGLTIVYGIINVTYMFWKQN